MNAVKIVFPKATNLFCRFHIDKNVKTKCKTLVGQKNAWDYVMEAWESLVDYPFEQEFNDSLMKFEIVCSPWSMLVDYVMQTWLIPHKHKFVKTWTNKVMYLGNTTTNRYKNCKSILVLITRHQWIKIIVCVYFFVFFKCRVESAHWALKRILHNSLRPM